MTADELNRLTVALLMSLDDEVFKEGPIPKSIPWLALQNNGQALTVAQYNILLGVLHSTGVLEVSTTTISPGRRLQEIQEKIREFYPRLKDGSARRSV